MWPRASLRAASTAASRRWVSARPLVELMSPHVPPVGDERPPKRRTLGPKRGQLAPSELSVSDSRGYGQLVGNRMAAAANRILDDLMSEAGPILRARDIRSKIVVLQVPGSREAEWGRTYWGMRIGA